MSESTDNYLKTIYSLSKQGSEYVSTNMLASKVQAKASSATDMIKKLDQRGLVEYTKYQGVKLTPEGEKIAIDIIRRHRIWEVFLSEKLGFAWDEIHDIAEQLEHVASPELIERLYTFLKQPKYDPHGDPIPDMHGKLPRIARSAQLAECTEGEKVKVISVDDSSSEMLVHLAKLKIMPGSQLTIKKRHEFDESMQVKLNSRSLLLSGKVAESIQVQKIKS